MDCKKWVQDIMQQKFLDSDLTRLIMLNFFIENNRFQSKYSKYDLLTYIYRIYMDYPNLSSINPSIKVKNIRKFGITDFKDVLDKALFEWDKYATNSTLIYDDLYLYVNVDINDDSIVNNTRKVIKMLNKKYFFIDLNSPKELTALDICKDDNNGMFGYGLFKDRVLEDMQYCPLCEEIDTDRLFAVHIVPLCDCDEIEKIDKNNGIILCEQHAKDYLEKKYYFNENGYVVNNNSCIVNNKMHLNIQLKKIKRHYLIKNSKNSLDRFHSL